MSETPMLDYIEANAHIKRCVSERDAEIAALRQQVAELENALSKRAEQQETMWKFIRGMADTYHKIRYDIDMKFTSAMMELDKLRD